MGRPIERHGLYGTGEYKSWSEMIQRCRNENNHAYSKYGGRGISVYEPWIYSFTEFYNYIGPKPSPVHSIDRIDNDGNYEPGNVRWATKATQSGNRGNVVRYDFYGQKLMCHEIDSHLGVRKGTFRSALSRGYEVEEIAVDIAFSLRRIYKPYKTPQRTPVVNYDGRDWTVKEIAEHFDISYRRVYKLLFGNKNSSVERTFGILEGNVRGHYDLVRPGDKIGRLTILEDITKPGEQKRWLAECDCGSGKRVSVLQGNLRNGHVSSCGCLRLTRN